MIERKIEIEGKPLKITEHSRNGVTAISTKDQLSSVFNSAAPQTNVSSVIRGETYAVLSFSFSYGGIEELSMAAQLKKKFDHFYYGLKQNQMMYWYRGLFPLFNKDKLLVSRLKAIVRVEPPETFRIKAGGAGQAAKDFADAVYANRNDRKVKELIWEAFKGQRTFSNFEIDFDAEDERLESGTLNIAFLLVEGDAPKFSGVKIFGSRVVKNLLKKNALAFYRGFVVPHLSIFESRMRNTFQNGNFMVYDPASTLGDQFPAVFEQFGRTASTKQKGDNMSDNNLRNKVIRLAHQKPELRKDLLPLLKEARLHDKALALRIQNSKAGKAYGLYFAAGFKSNRADSDGAITYEYETNIQNGNTKEVIYIDVTKWDSDDESYSVQAKYGKGTWDYYSEKDLHRNLPSILANLEKQLGGSRKASSTEQLLGAKEISIKGLGIYVVVGVEGGDILLRQMGGRKEYTLSVMVGGSLLGNGAELKGRGNTRMRTKFIQGKDITVIS